jgi:phage shock protein A
MFKQIMVLIRAKAHDAEQDFTDRNAIPILSQQIREAAHSVNAARKAVAVAMAQHRMERDAARHLSNRIFELETRAIAALDQGKESLARDAAVMIAQLEADLASNKNASEQFEVDIERLKELVRRSEARLAALQRGARLAVARDRTQRLARDVTGSDISTLADAEATLARLESRQKELELTTEALDSLSVNVDPATMIQKLAEAGCGAPLTITADEVLARLNARRS